MKIPRGRELLVALGICWMIWITASVVSPYFPGLVPHHIEHEEYAETDAKPSISDPFFVFRFGDFLEGHSGLATAIATIFIAYFTFSLRASTDKLWKAGADQLNIAMIAADAARKSADVAISVERPIVFLAGLELLTEGPPFGAGVRVPIEGVPPDQASVIAIFRNYGRTPAIVTGVYWQHWIGTRLPETPEYREEINLPTGTIIKEGGKEFEHAPLWTIPISEPEHIALRTYKADLWIYGMIRFQDFMGGRHVHRFCQLWHGVERGIGSDTPNGFVEAGPEAYRGNTYEPPAA